MSTSPALDHSPLVLEGTGTGVLLVHGFTGSPVSMKPWAQQLRERLGPNLAVQVPLLPGHGTRWQDLDATTWTEWYAEADRALTALRADCDTVVVAGLSMGGCLALRLAQQRPQDVAGLVLVNPAIASRDPRLRLVPVLKHVVGSLAAIGDDIKKPGVSEGAYPRTPLKALHSMMRMWPGVVGDLGRIACPTVLLRSVDDHVVDDSTATLLERHVPQLDHVALTNSFHVATLDHDLDVIVDATVDLLERLREGDA